MKTSIQIITEAQEGITARREAIAGTKISSLNPEQASLKQAAYYRKAAENSEAEQATDYRLIARDMQMGAYMNVIGEYAKWRPQ